MAGCVFRSPIGIKEWVVVKSCWLARFVLDRPQIESPRVRCWHVEQRSGVRELTQILE